MWALDLRGEETRYIFRIDFDYDDGFNDDMLFVPPETFDYYHGLHDSNM